jgi:5-methylcytosine-specific restriction endonuclease McrA
MTNRRISRRLRLLVRERAHGCCEYCLSQEAYATQGFSVEHITPLNAEGTTTASNLALACQGCNNFKYDKTAARDPVSHQVVPLFHPRRDNWHAHFIWNPDCTLIIGVTPTGRATIATLQLNREGIVNLRRLLVMTGKHPPQSLS